MAEPKHPFRDDLDDQSVLHSTVTRKPIVGRDRILRTIQAAGASYDHMRPTYHEAIGNRSFAEYDARIAGGPELHCVAAITRKESGAVETVIINFTPLDGALALAEKLKQALASEIGADYFL
ncbi:hypothetical protein A0J57_18925 [Sphingobium sp. 22B]|uniref:hypothetical protein n=1 Tax=unclassified Sphingobium TaxID=2611147 RepID=UPI000784A9A0|nr:MULTISPECIES: hypothetical protein [unclassified Sphingobium]KXU30511.1 hypothetical protein AXW74_17530 [Sphingobium sp. AM]KYC30770.1 hypothetical protein A0J57_18925 [Sphingobium sp. 22B]OAP30066.1 hypothetical protein A8O16_20510 [Sphingobium sp. 20006FA]